MSRKKKDKPVLELEIESIAFEGLAVARKDNLVYFVKHAVPGDIVKVRALRKRKGYVQTQLLEVIKKSDLRIEPKCRYYGVCGGCSWQNLSYEEQLSWKKRHVKDAFERIGKVEYGNLYDVLPSPKVFNYRNKMEFSFGASRWLEDKEIAEDGEIINKDFAFGLHIPGRYDKILDIEECHIQPEEGNEILNVFRSKALSLGLTAYRQKEHTGFLRNLVMRTSESYHKMMLILITQSPSSDNEKHYIEWFLNEVPVLFPFVSSLIHAVNDTFSPVAAGEIKEVVGDGYLKEQILDVEFKISPFSFFQTNSRQLNQFIGKIIDTASLSSDSTVWDLYCGTGSITLPVAKRVKKVLGFEMVESSIADAKANAEFNAISNAGFHTLDLHSKDISEMLDSYEKPDMIFIDPPRAGMHKNLINLLLSLDVPEIVYVSCNPSTQARDCAVLAEKYDIKSLQPVDMFPHTYHIENIALLKLKNYDGIEQ
jgi:23S rRNA (uracil1939-C5)-methyltransferase